MDLTWLVIPIAVGLFLARTAMIARKLKIAAANPTLADPRALREARRSLEAHRMRLDDAIASVKGHLEDARRLSRAPSPRAQVPKSQVARMIENSDPTSRF